MILIIKNHNTNINQGTNKKVQLLLKVTKDGTPGLVGAQGPVGPQGPAGPAGSQGIPGTAATIQVGAVVTGAPNTPVLISNSGTSSTAVFDFTIPRGPKGDSGTIDNLTIDCGVASSVYLVGQYINCGNA